MDFAQDRPYSESPPDFRHINTWIFDLDNTLYHADSTLFAQIESRMTEFIAPPARRSSPVRLTRCSTSISALRLVFCVG